MDAKLNTRAKPILLYVAIDIEYFLMHWIHIALKARDSNYEVHVTAPPIGDWQSIIEYGFNFHPLLIDRREGLPWKELSGIANLCFLMKQIKPNIVHNISVKTILYGGIAARITSIPAMLCAFTGLGYVYISPSIKAKLLKTIISMGYKYIFRHRNVKAVFQNKDDLNYMVDSKIVKVRRTMVIHGAGVDTNKFYPTPTTEGPTTVILPGRMLYDKGIQEFVDAVKIIKKKHAKVRFALVGDVDTGNPTSIPKSVLLDWQTKGCVEWWGKCSDMPSIYSKAHIVCLPSYREGLPTVLSEASACGRPIVATDVPGCREIVSHGVNGLLVPPKDCKALSDALLQLIGNSELRAKMGARGYEIALNGYSVGKIVSETLSLYSEMLKN